MLTAPLELRDHARSALVVPRESMYPIGSIHNRDFQDLVQEHKGDNRDSLVAAAYLEVTDPPYSIRHVRFGPAIDL